METKDVQEVLADAIRKRDELNIFIRVLKELAEPASVGSHGSAGTAQIPDPVSLVAPGLFLGKSQAEAAKLLLETVRRPLQPRVIAKCLESGGLRIGGKQPLVNLWGVLHRNRKRLGFVLIPKQGWGLAEWGKKP